MTIQEKSTPEERVRTALGKERRHQDAKNTLRWVSLALFIASHLSYDVNLRNAERSWRSGRRRPSEIATAVGSLRNLHEGSPLKDCCIGDALTAASHYLDYLLTNNNSDRKTAHHFSWQSLDEMLKWAETEDKWDELDQIIRFIT